MSALLDFVKYNELSNWSVAHLLQNHFNYNKDFELVKIGSFLKRNKTQIIVDDNTTYKRVTIKLYNNGVFLRDTEIGKNIGTKKQFIIKEGQFLLSKIDARNGAFGIATNEVDKAIITADFLAFDIDTSKINPDFLVLITTTKKFMQFAQSASSGTTGRQRIDESKFLDTKIPLPSVEIQKQIVEDYQNRICLAHEQEERAKDLEKDIEEYLYGELGLNTTSKQTDQLLNFTQFSCLSRWDTGFLLDNNISHSKYALVPINSVIDKFLKNIDNSSLRFGSSKYPDSKFNYIGMENIEKETGNLLKLDEVNGIDIKSQTIKLPKYFFLYGKLRPYLNKYFFNDLEFDNIIVSSEFFVFSVKNINEQYFKYILSSSFIQSQIENHMKGARMPRISEDTFRNLVIPTPTIEVQNKIVKHIYELKNNIKLLNQKSEQNKILALEEFEKEVFNEA